MFKTPWKIREKSRRFNAEDKSLQGLNIYQEPRGQYKFNANKDKPSNYTAKNQRFQRFDHFDSPHPARSRSATVHN